MKNQVKIDGVLWMGYSITRSTMMIDECLQKTKKSRSDIMTIPMAVAAKKSSKLHKLKPRSVKRDRTKTEEGKNKTKERKAARDMKI